MAEREDEPQIVAGCRMPSHSGIAKTENFAYAQARIGCDALLARLQAFAVKHYPESELARAARAAADAGRPRVGFAAPEGAA